MKGLLESEMNESTFSQVPVGDLDLLLKGEVEERMIQRKESL